MNKINLEKYFSDDNKKYDSTYLIKILEEYLGKSFDQIREDISDKKVTVIAEEIKEYLDKEFISENPDLYERIRKPRPTLSQNASEWKEEDKKAYVKGFADKLIAEKYYFEPYTLEYFNRYTDIVRNKINLLLDIINGLANKEINPIQETLNELDIKMDKDGKVSKDDMIRLIVPTVVNINMLEEKVEKANDLSTYLTFKMSKHSLYKDGWSESEVYPMSSLQTQSDMNDWRDDNIKLSKNQKIILKKRQEESRKIIADFLTSLDL